MARKQIDCYVLDERMGGGSYGEVWRGRTIGCTPSTVALRRICRNVERKVNRLRNEVRLLRGVSHTNILSFHGLRKTPSHFYLALEYCIGGDLAHFLRARGPLPEVASWRFCIQITAGLLALHRNHFCHGNLQPQSVLLSNFAEDAKLKLANFSCQSEPNPYMAPEVLRGDPCNRQADMWSAGAILYEMLFGRPPFLGASRSQLLASHFSSEVSFTEEREITGEGRSFCRSLLGRHYAERLSSCDCEGHSYVKRGPPSCEATSTSALARRSHSQMARAGKIQLGAFWFVRPTHLAFSRIAKHCIEMIGSFSAGEPDAELDSDKTEGTPSRNCRFAWSLGPGGLRTEDQLNISPVRCFVVGQLQHAHLFRFRTSCLFPRIMYSI